MNIDTTFYLQDYIKLLLKRADKLIRENIPEVTREAYIHYFETGNRLTFERQYFARREHLTVFGLTSSLWEDIKDLPEEDSKSYTYRLLQVIREVLLEKTWVLPAHGSVNHIDGKAQSIDLFSGETAGALSEILYIIKGNPIINKYYLEDYISICQEFLCILRERIFDIFLGKNPCDWWETASMNWTAVCAGNVGIACYYGKLICEKLTVKNNGKAAESIITDSEYGEIMDRVTKSMICYLKSMGKDGVCTEGCGYYKYGMEYFLRFYEILSGEGGNISAIGSFKEAAMFLQRIYLGNGNSVNFADCVLKNKTKLGMISYMANIYREVAVSKDFMHPDRDIMESLGGDECHRWLGAYLDYIWVKNYGSCLRVEEECQNHIFGESMWYVRKWEKNTAFYIKGGHNDESHNHNDVGSFGYIVNGEEILCDLGVGEYTGDYFGENRYSILCNSSLGHNVPIIDGRCQMPGREHEADEFYLSDGAIVITYGKAYGFSRGSDVKRKVSFNEKGGFRIIDIFGGKKNITESFVSKIKPCISKNKVFFNGKNGSAVIDLGDNVKPYVDEKIHKEHDGSEIRVYIIKADYVNKETAYIIDINVDKL